MTNPLRRLIHLPWSTGLYRERVLEGRSISNKDIDQNQLKCWVDKYSIVDFWINNFLFKMYTAVCHKGCQSFYSLCISDMKIERIERSDMKNHVIYSASDTVKIPEEVHDGK